VCSSCLHQRLKAATVDQIPDALSLPKRRDREPLPPAANPSHLQVAANTMTTNSTVTAGGDSQGYTHLSGFPMHGFPSFPAPAFPMQTYPMPNYPMPAPMYAPPYGYPFAPHGATQANTMQPNGFPAPSFLMQNYHMPNYPMPTPMYAPPSGYPFAMPVTTAPLGQGANVDPGRKRQFSVSNPQASSSDPIDEAGTLIPNTDPTFNDWLNTDLDTPEA
jgi:hypothetical protein